MSKKSRCKECGHKRGERSVGIMAKANGKEPDVHDEQPKKKSCGCVCHNKGIV